MKATKHKSKIIEQLERKGYIVEVGECIRIWKGNYGSVAIYDKLSDIPFRLYQSTK